MEFQPVKQEFTQHSPRQRPPSSTPRPPPSTANVIDLSDSDQENAEIPTKKQKLNGTATSPNSSIFVSPLSSGGCKSFWKAGDYEGSPCDGGWDNNTGGMDHVRVHPKFLHSNATSHKWALGAFAELLDNALDEVCYGATYVNLDVLINKKDRNRMLLVEDNGGGMDPEKMRQCMSLGYSAKSKLANTIGQCQ